MSRAIAESPGSLTIEGLSRPVRRAELGIHVMTEVWDEAARVWHYDSARAQAQYGIEIEVDGHSGEDGAPAPEVGNIPVARANGGRHPSLLGLATLAVRELDDGSDCDEWDAWLGNDAPGLCGNRVTFQGWEGNALRVHWEAHYDQRRRRRPFLYEGLVVFTGIAVKVKQPEEADVFLKRAWGGQAVETLERHVLGWSDHGAKFAPDRRFWYSVVYGRKGRPLASQHRVGAPTKEAATARVAEERKARQVQLQPPTPAPHLKPGPPKRLPESGKRFSLEVTWDWEVVPAEEDPVMAELGGLSLRRGTKPREETLKVVTVQMLAANTLVGYVDTSVGAYKGVWDVEQRGEVKLAGKKAVRVVLLQSLNRVQARLLKYFVELPKKQALAMTFAAPPDAFAARVEAYEALAGSLRLER